MLIIRQLTAIKPQQSHIHTVLLSHTDIHLPTDPSSLGIHQLQAPLVNLITFLAWIPLNLLQPVTLEGGPLDHSIKRDHMGTRRD